MTLCYVNKPSRRVATPPQHRALIVGKCSLKGHVSLACLQGSVTLGFDLIPQALIANYDHNRKYPKMCLNFTIFRQMESSVSVHVNEMSLNCWQMT